MKQTKQQSEMAKLFEFAGKYKTLTIISCIFSGISAILVLSPFVCLWGVVKETFKVFPDFSLLGETNCKVYAWSAIVLAVVGFMFYYVTLTCSHIAAFNTARNMKQAVIEHLATLPLGFFTKNSSGKLRKIIDENADQTEKFLAHQMPDMIGAFVSIITIIVFMFIFDWRLGLLSLVPLILGFIVQGVMMSTTAVHHMKASQDSMEDMNKEAVEYVRGIPVVKVFGQTVFSFNSFYNSIKVYKENVIAFAMACKWPMTAFITTINITFIFLIPAGILFSSQAVNYTDFLTSWLFYIMITPACGAMLIKIMYISNNKLLAEEAVRRITSLIDEEPLVQPEKGRRPSNYDICFDQVTFGYEVDKLPVLKRFSVEIPQGKTYAIVGPSGSGKTTAASLIPRFYDVNEGAIRIGGINVKEIAEKDLMDTVAFVFQNVQLLKISILDNIKMGKPDATIEEVWKAIDLAQCRDIIEKQPEGIHTMIGSKGTYLSGGEQQRIALARAILKDAPIIVLDEATAFADAENEHRIQKALSTLIKGKTVLMIAHRLTTIQQADKILVLDQGQLVESGNHEQLLKHNGMYAKMWKEYKESVSWGIENKETEVQSVC